MTTRNAPVFDHIEVKVSQHTDQWGAPIEARSLHIGEAMLVVVSDKGIIIYTLNASDPGIANLAKTQSLAKDL